MFVVGENWRVGWLVMGFHSGLRLGDCNSRYVGLRISDMLVNWLVEAS